MSWSNREKAAVKMAHNALGWERPQYELILRNIAGVRQHLGKISAANPGNNTDGFIRFMAFAERSGYVDPKRPRGYWIGQAALECPRMHYRIGQLTDLGIMHGLLGSGEAGSGDNAVITFIYRMTQQRPQGPTYNLKDCDWEWSYKILEGLKAWLFREAKKRGLKLDLTTETQSHGGQL